MDHPGSITHPVFTTAHSTQAHGDDFPSGHWTRRSNINTPPVMNAQNTHYDVNRYTIWFFCLSAMKTPSFRPPWTK